MAKLAAYRAKRDFGKTPEPQGGDEGGSDFAFVIQKHDASRLHYDLRLELDGVMLSWAVAKGPSLVPGEKRLAVHTEDHPIAYNTFEGTIPKGQYGGGTVMVWDRGRWAPNEDPHRGYRKGHLDFRLEGEKIRGAFHLVRMRPRPGEKQEAWLLIKSDDDFARSSEEPDILAEKPLSVTTGRTMDEIASDRKSAVWQSNREPKEEPAPAKARSRKAAAPAAEPAPASRAARPKAAREAKASDPDEDPAAADPSGAPSPDRKALTRGGRPAPMPQDIEPCLATSVEEAPRGADWLHEIKWDGYRLLAFVARGKARIATRRGHDWTQRFPGIAEAAAALPVDKAILDGEAVIEDETGAASFSALQNALSDEHGRIARDAVLYAFDLLYLDGVDLRPLPLVERKARLAAIVPAGGGGAVRLSEHIEGDGAAMVRSVCGMGLEGVISKRRDRPYRSGRGSDWLKIKCIDRQEFVVAGYVPSTAAPRAVGSVVLGYHEGGRLTHAGRSGTGFTAETARETWRKLDALKRPTSPFPDRLSAEERRGVVWAEPKLVAEIEFRGWTGDARLRHAAFKGLREDKDAAEVVREAPRRAATDTAQAGSAAPTTAKAPRSRAASEVGGVALSNPGRVLWPEGITKRDLARFYGEIAEWVLPHLVRRPLSLVRCPDGMTGSCFFQKHSWAGIGEHVRRMTVRDEDGDEEEVLFIEGLPGLVSLVQVGVLEIHPWGATIADVERPDRITMDLDPAGDVPWSAVVEAARDVRERLDGVGLQSFVKTTGGKGLHVVVPLTPSAGWREAKDFAHALALAMEADDPRRYIAKASKEARKGLIYVDYLRNGRGATAIGAYSTRARADAPVSVPVDWSELGPGLKPNGITLRTLPARLAGLRADPWADMGRIRQTLPGRGRTGRSRRPA